MGSWLYKEESMALPWIKPPEPEITKYFIWYDEWFINGNVQFEGLLKDEYKKIDDATLIKIIDGGRINKGYRLKNIDGLFEGMIHNYSQREIRELIDAEEKNDD